jgi:hypothetical protein
MTSLESPKTLADILAWLDQVDQGLVVATPEEHAAVGALLVAKIDNTKGVIDELEFQEARLRKAAKELSDGARQVANRVDRIKGYIAHNMQVNGFPQLPGECWKVKLNTSLSVEPKREPTEDDWVQGTGLVCAKYEWDKKKLKSALEALDPAAMEVASLAASASVSIVVNKGRLA